MIAKIYMTPDELFMQRALELAQLGVGRVSPNPRVGCVVVHDGKIIGEGWHQKFGEAHAEVNAINSVKDHTLLSDSTVFVNLEPCAHFGKTPPCADLLIEKNVRRVMIANTDPYHEVGGRGIEKLTNAGIAVEVGVCAAEGRVVNKRFFTWVEKRRPFIFLKWAQTADGFIAHTNYESKWISHEQALQVVHKMRSEEDAVLVGTRTAAHDNPQLSVRHWRGRNPVRVVLDRFLRLSEKLHLFDGTQPTLVYNVLKHEEHPKLIFARVPEEKFIEAVVRDLYAKNIQSIMVEGGAQTLQLFFEAGLWDEAHVIISDRAFGKGIPAPQPHGKLISTEAVGPDQWMIYTN